MLDQKYYHSEIFRKSESARELTKMEYSVLFNDLRRKDLRIYLDALNAEEPINNQVNYVMRKATGDCQVYRGQLPSGLEKQLRDAEIERGKPFVS